MLIALLEAAQELNVCSHGNTPTNGLIHWEQGSELLLLLTGPPPAPADFPGQRMPSSGKQQDYLVVA